MYIHVPWMDVKDPNIFCEPQLCESLGSRAQEVDIMRPFSAAPGRAQSASRYRPPARASSAAPRASAGPRLITAKSTAHVPAPRPLPTTLSASMQTLMSQITFKSPPPPPPAVVARPPAIKHMPGQMGVVAPLPPPPQQRAASTASGQQPAGMGTAANVPRRGHKIEHGIGPDLGYYVWDAPASHADALGRKDGVHPGRCFGSAPPPAGDRHPIDSGAFERLLPHEAEDRLAGVGGTTLPGAESLTAIHDAYYEAQEINREYDLAEKAAMARERRAKAERAKQMTLPSSVKSRFAWGSERISHALLLKLDAFTARNEDYTRKLLWTFGTDEALTGGGSQIRITPQNMPRMCDRFGIACTAQQAAEIFDRHQLPTGGCSVQQLTKAFIESKVDVATIVRDQARRLHGDAARPQAALRQRTPLKPEPPHAHAHILEHAWSNHTERKREAVQKIATAVTDHHAVAHTSSAEAPPKPAPRRPMSAVAVRASADPPYAGMAGGTRAAARAAATQQQQQQQGWPY